MIGPARLCFHRCPLNFTGYNMSAWLHNRKSGFMDKGPQLSLAWAERFDSGPQCFCYCCDTVQKTRGCSSSMLPMAVPKHSVVIFISSDLQVCARNGNRRELEAVPVSSSG